MTYLKVICFNIYDFQSYNKPCTFSAGWLIELEKEIKYYKAFLAINDEKDNEIKY